MERTTQVQLFHVQSESISTFFNFKVELYEVEKYFHLLPLVINEYIRDECFEYI